MVFTHQILAGDAEIDRALADLASNLGSRQEHHFDIVQALDAGVVLALVAGQADGEPCLGQHVQRLFLEPAFRRNCQRDHGPVSRNASMRSSQTEKPTPGIGVFAPSKVSNRS